MEYDYMFKKVKTTETGQAKSPILRGVYGYFVFKTSLVGHQMIYEKCPKE